MCPCVRLPRALLALWLCSALAACWPDGAPCLSSVFESMYPDAAEHVGGLQETEPPFWISMSRKCYWPHQSIRIELRGRNKTDLYKGFALQARRLRSIEGLGEFVRDDNGAWKYHCFNKKYSTTHSHRRAKNEVYMYWEYKDAGGYLEPVQFIATVVAEKHKYWVQKVRSAILPPCSRKDEFVHGPKPEEILYPEPRTRKTMKPLKPHEHDRLRPWGPLADGRPTTRRRTTTTTTTRRPTTTTRRPTTTTRRTTTRRTTTTVPWWLTTTTTTTTPWWMTTTTTVPWWKTTTTTTAVPWWKTTTTTKRAPAGCFDKVANCNDWEDLCGGDSSYVNDNCRKTCRYC